MLATEAKAYCKPFEEIFEGYLGRAPVAHALIRSAEAFHVGRHRFARPILDLGCGKGEFASLVFQDQVDAAVDRFPSRVAQARRTGRYGELYEADGCNLPFANATFGSVLSVSVLEHIQHAESVVAEIFRVLKPGGAFVGTIVLADLHEHLFFCRLFKRLWLSAVATLYSRCQAWWFQHLVLLSSEKWERMFANAGFRILTSRKAVSPRLTRIWDLFLPLAALDRLLRPVGLSWLVRPRWLRKLVARLFTCVVCEQDTEGSILFLIAEKPFEHTGSVTQAELCLPAGAP